MIRLDFVVVVVFLEMRCIKSARETGIFSFFTS